MICPLLSSPHFVLCQSTRCGWWDNIRQCCAVLPLCLEDVVKVSADPILDSDVELSGGVNE